MRGGLTRAPLLAVTQAALAAKEGRGVFEALIAASAGDIAMHALWTTLESAQRISMCVLLRGLLRALGDATVSQATRYAWATGLSAMAFVYCLVHHQTFWRGMRMGMRWRVAIIGAVHAKALRLEAGKASEGHLTNLVSTDVEKFAESGTYYPWLFFGPLEALVVCVLIAQEIGALSAVLGMIVFILMVPMQILTGGKVTTWRMRTAKRTDARISATAEAIKSALALKMYGFERTVIERIMALRLEETRALRWVTTFRAMGFTSFFVSDFIAVAAALGSYVAGGGTLSVASSVYVMSLLRLSKVWMGIFFWRGFETTSEARASSQRIGAFLLLPEAGGHAAPGESEAVAARLNGCDFFFSTPPAECTQQGTLKQPSEEGSDGAKAMVGDEGDTSEGGVSADGIKSGALRPALRGVRLELMRGEVLAVVGTVGCGKSALLSALMGNMTARGGGLPELPPRLAFCSQEPWLVAGTVRENVVFGARGAPFDAPRYRQALECTALEHDLEILPHGDATLLGERGINLSGGQRARLALARVIYSGLPVCLLDDPLAAVDSTVRRHIFEQCIATALKGKTVVLCTHQRQYLPRCDRVAVLDGGELVALGSHAEVQATLRRKRPDLASLVDSGAAAAGGGDANAGESVRSAVLGSSSMENIRELLANDDASSTDDKRAAAKVTDVGVTLSEKSKDGGLVREFSRIGKVETRVYMQVLRRLGLGYAALLLFTFVLSQLLAVGASVVVLEWSSRTAVEQDDAIWWGGYLLVLGLLLLVAPARNLGAMHGLVTANSNVHTSMLRSVVGARLSFFHTNPTGRILNRFSKDVSTGDELLPFTWVDVMQCVLVMLSCIIILSLALPLSLPAALLLLLLFMWLRRIFLMSSREIKRNEGVSRSPIYAHFNASLSGLSTIRCYGAEETNHAAFLDALHENAAWMVSFIGVQRWLGFRLDAICAVLVSVAALTSVAQLDSLGYALVALALESALLLSGNLQWAVRQTAELAVHLTAVERCLDYCDLPQDSEGDEVKKGGKNAVELAAWPAEGRLELDGLCARYRPGLPLVLSGVTLTVPAGTSLGIVGRTGSGKSSLLLAIFKLIDTAGGTLQLDGVDSRDVPLAAWRRRLAIIPQDAIFFSASVRYNLDPNGDFNDAALWDALRAAQMDGVVRERGGLDAALDSGLGTALSAGQKQLLALARVLLSDSPVLCLDEATANTDADTDRVIQSVLNEGTIGTGGGQSRARTLLLIAHRLDTIRGADQVAVMGDGRVLEAGAPDELVANEASAFRALVDSAAGGN